LTKITRIAYKSPTLLTNWLRSPTSTCNKSKCWKSTRHYISRSTIRRCTRNMEIQLCLRTVTLGFKSWRTTTEENNYQNYTTNKSTIYCCNQIWPIFQISLLNWRSSTIREDWRETTSR